MSRPRLDPRISRKPVSRVTATPARSVGTGTGLECYLMTLYQCYCLHKMELQYRATNNCKYDIRMEGLRKATKRRLGPLLVNVFWTTRVTASFSCSITNWARNLIQCHLSIYSLIYRYLFISILSYFVKIEYAYEITLLSVCVCVFRCIPPIVARQRLGKYPPIVTSQRFYKNPPIAARKLLGSVKIPLSLLGNGSEETLPR
jgi:hypothetical protein